MMGTNVYSRNPSPGDQSYNNHYNYVSNNAGGGGNDGWAQTQHPEASYQGWQQPNQTNNGWVDESSYNGPYYGRQEAYGR